MSALLDIRDKIRDFLRQYDEIISPVFKFIVAYIAFSFINLMYGYEPLFNKSIVVVLLAIICALVSDRVTVLVATLVVMMNVLAVSKELAVLFLVVVIIMYCMYIRLFPDSAWLLILVPILYKMNITYAIPMIVMMFVGMTGIVPIAFGGVLYYMSVYTREVSDIIKTLPEENDFQIYKYMLDALKDNKEFLVQIIVFAAAIIIGNIFYRLSIDYAWYIGIAVCAVVSMIFFVVCGNMLEVDISIGTVFGGTMLGLVVALVLQVFKSMVDYSRKESVQFEDDEYYYYVKAIPKYNVDVKKKSEATAKSRPNPAANSTAKPAAKTEVKSASTTDRVRTAVKNQNR